MVFEILGKGVAFKSSFLIHSLETCKVPLTPLESPQCDVELGVHLL